MVLSPRCPECGNPLVKLNDEIVTEKRDCFNSLYEKGGWYCPDCGEVKYGRDVNF